MPIDAKHEDLQSLRIDRTERGAGNGEPPAWARRYILIGIVIVAVLSLSALAYRMLSRDVPEVEVTRASAESSDVGGTVLSATGYIVAHHTINVNSKVTGRLAWIGVEKGDKVKEGQVLVRLEDQEFRASYDQAKGALDNARAYLDELEHGSRPEEIQQAQHNLDEARATLVDDKLTLDRTKELSSAGVVSRQVMDDATAKFESDQQRVNSLDKAFQLMKIGPRAGRNRTRPRIAGASAGPVRLRQVATRRHRDSRARHRHDSRPHCRKRRTDHRAVCQRGGGWSAGIGGVAGGLERYSGRARYRAVRLCPARSQAERHRHDRCLSRPQVQRRNRADLA